MSARSTIFRLYQPRHKSLADQPNFHYSLIFHNTSAGRSHLKKRPIPSMTNFITHRIIKVERTDYTCDKASLLSHISLAVLPVTFASKLKVDRVQTHRQLYMLLYDCLCASQ